MVTLRVLFAMTLGALVAALGALFLGEYEFDEPLPIAAGFLLGFIIAEIVVSIGHHQSKTMAAILASWAIAAVVLAGYLDTNLNEPMKPGVYLSAGLSGLAAAARGNSWLRDYRAKGRSTTTAHDVRSTTDTRRSPVSRS